MKAPMPWFRMYVDFLNDPKMIALAFEDQRHFIGVLALKSDGVLDSGCDAKLLDRIVAQRLWIDQAAIVEVKKRLISGGLIGADWQPIAWEKRQYNSDRSAERTRKYRQRQRESEQEDMCDVTVTSQQRFCDALDTETETETETEEKIERVRSPRGSRLPDDFPSNECMDWCRKERPDLDPVELRDKFRDYWCAVPGARGRKADWPATWRNFVRSEFGRKARDAPKQARYANVIAEMTGRSKKQEEYVDVIATRIS